ncbi:MAG: hypothetical protein SGI77_16830 [Pirellulaceae bacterium]|nr:hypothetical protein [Pirellulaceae bacterium]
MGIKFDFGAAKNCGGSLRAGIPLMGLVIELQPGAKEASASRAAAARERFILCPLVIEQIFVAG